MVHKNISLVGTCYVTLGNIKYICQNLRILFLSYYIIYWDILKLNWLTNPLL